MDAAWLRYLLEQLNTQPGGGGRFEQLAAALVHRRKVANIKPATPPSSGGDLGVDARTTKRLLEHEPVFRMYETPPEADEHWIFAFSIEKKWKPKLTGDLKTIIANGFTPSRVVFVTNQRISPERIKIQEERKLAERFKRQVEILDGSWIEQQLLSDDYYLAVIHLGAPPLSEPRLGAFAKRVAALEAKGISPIDALEVDRLERAVQYHNRSTDYAEHFFCDVTSLAGILASHPDTRLRGIEWYRVAWQRAKEGPTDPGAMGLAYAYLRALADQPGLHDEMLDGVDRYVDMVIESNVPYHARGAANLLLHLMPTRSTNTRWLAVRDRLRAWCTSAPGRGYGQASSGHAADAALVLGLTDRNLAKDAVALHAYIVALTNHIATYRAVRPVPLEHWAGVLSQIPEDLSQSEAFDVAHQLTIEVVREREGDVAAARLQRDRALKLRRAGRYAEAVRHASRAQLAWFSQENRRGSLLMGLLIADCFQSLERPWAARAALYQVWQVATTAPRHEDLDLVPQVFLELNTCAVKVGWWREAFYSLQRYYAACSLARIEPAPEVAEHVQGTVPVLLEGLRRVAPKIHERLLEQARSTFPGAALTHEELHLATDEAFESWLDDPELTAEAQSELRIMRARMRSGDFPFSPPPVDEAASLRVLESSWDHALGTSMLRVTTPNTRHGISTAIDLMSQFEAWLIFTNHARLCVVDDVVQIRIREGGVAEESGSITVLPDGTIELLIVPEKIEESYDAATTEAMNLALGGLVTAVIGSSLDDPKEIFDGFAPPKFARAREAIASAAPPGYIAANTLTFAWQDDAR